MHQRQNRELMGWREQPACSPKASWGPTWIISYGGRLYWDCTTCLLRPLCSLLFLTVFLCMGVVQAALLDAAMCCVPLGYMAPWEGMLFQFLGSPLPLLSWGKRLSFASLVQQNMFRQVGSLTLPADSLGVSVCARISSEIPHSSCTGFFSSKWIGSFHHPIRLGALPAPSQAPLPAHRTIEVVSDAWLFAAVLGTPRLCSAKKQRI